ncbi:unnamed protein product [Vitrella brassicaformis CCMP3155]|uniref:Uncharacterized protein n=2 Tax=Vitrella brassicaformis TaxID=1169539 RepID=A0A0G4FJK7_VITBC|nr:unnamed protein product [Vitrella brassicaformis CCMP3155]|eukprot:CEM13932.1 unnamed protein product [Vitrella brassicaformis CCMP3155]
MQDLRKRKRLLSESTRSCLKALRKKRLLGILKVKAKKSSLKVAATYCSGGEALDQCGGQRQKLTSMLIEQLLAALRAKQKAKTQEQQRGEEPLGQVEPTGETELPVEATRAPGGEERDGQEGGKVENEDLDDTRAAAPLVNVDEFRVYLAPGGDRQPVEEAKARLRGLLQLAGKNAGRRGCLA